MWDFFVNFLQEARDTHVLPDYLYTGDAGEQAKCLQIMASECLETWECI